MIGEYPRTSGEPTTILNDRRMVTAAEIAGESCAAYLATGQTECYDSDGHVVPCIGSGQDGEFRVGRPWPVPRFLLEDEVVCDKLTGLTWTRNANIAEFPLTWQDAFSFVADLNRNRAFGFGDWRLPNRNELRSLVSYDARRPSLPVAHPFTNVFLGWYWTSTTAVIAPAHAWYVHLEGARMFYGGKDQSYLAWPVRGRPALPATGQERCFDSEGKIVSCVDTGQDGELQTGFAWPHPRFAVQGDVVSDALTNLVWRRQADLGRGPTSWVEAFDAVRQLNPRGEVLWRLPNINELASLLDAANPSPALPSDHPFTDLQSGYWSSTTSAVEPDWAWALYLDKGALGVGQKKGRHFYVWAVKV